MNALGQVPYQRTILITFLFIALLLSLDILFDIREGTTWSHVAIEIVAFIAASIPCILALFMVLKGFMEKETSFRQDIQRLNCEKEQWKTRTHTYLTGLSEAIDAQFEKWGFSPAEKDIALLVLKGLSHKEIADARGTVEKTVRQQAGSIYAKAGLEGKSQLSAFFLDDLQFVSKKDKLIN